MFIIVSHVTSWHYSTGKNTVKDITSGQTLAYDTLLKQFLYIQCPEFKFLLNCHFLFQDLTNLGRFPHLVSLSMKDPLYSPCPVSQLCNYSTHMLYHLPSLQRLDTYDITAKPLAELAEVFSKFSEYLPVAEPPSPLTWIHH